jgi:hypothetical protein
MITRNFGSKGLPARNAANLPPFVSRFSIEKIWGPRRPTTLWAFMACYRDSFTFTFYVFIEELFLLEYNSEYVENQETFRSMCFASSGSKNKPSKKPTWSRQQALPASCCDWLILRPWRIDTTFSSGTSVDLQRSTRCYIPFDSSS